MNMELNKIAGAVCGSLLFVMGSGMIAQTIFTPQTPAVPGYALAGAPAAAVAAAPAAPVEPLPVLLARADVKKGESAARKCAACHAFEKGGANKVGPALWGVVERAKAAVAGFGYSAVLKEQAGKGQAWSFDSLNAFIENPKKYAPGTTMAFAGVASPAERADILAYLRSLADSPAALPSQ